MTSAKKPPLRPNILLNKDLKLDGISEVRKQTFKSSQASSQKKKCAFFQRQEMQEMKKVSQLGKNNERYSKFMSECEKNEVFLHRARGYSNQLR